MLKDKCGGNFKYTQGVKDCNNSSLSHSKERYKHERSKRSTIIKIRSDRNESVI
jgi:hypothetical protein